MLQPRLFGSAFLAFLSLASLAVAETRFGRPVVKLANPKDFEFINLEDNRFPMVRKNATSVACITYKESQRYYVEVSVTNQSDGPIELTKDFVQFKSNANVPSLDTLMVAADVQKTAASSAGSPGISASRSSSISSGSITVDEGQRGSAQSMLESINRASQLHANQLVERLTTFAHEKQDLTLAPKGTRFYVFVFEQPDRKKAPFEISVTAQSATWVFAYKE
jgi:hypothetical protein